MIDRIKGPIQVASGGAEKGSLTRRARRWPLCSFHGHSLAPAARVHTWLGHSALTQPHFGWLWPPDPAARGGSCPCHGLCGGLTSPPAGGGAVIGPPVPTRPPPSCPVAPTGTPGPLLGLRGLREARGSRSDLLAIKSVALPFSSIRATDGAQAAWETVCYTQRGWGTCPSIFSFRFFFFSLKISSQRMRPGHMSERVSPFFFP